MKWETVDCDCDCCCGRNCNCSFGSGIAHEWMANGKLHKHKKGRHRYTRTHRQLREWANRGAGAGAHKGNPSSPCCCCRRRRWRPLRQVCCCHAECLAYFLLKMRFNKSMRWRWWWLKRSGQQTSPQDGASSRQVKGGFGGLVGWRASRRGRRQGNNAVRVIHMRCAKDKSTYKTRGKTTKQRYKMSGIIALFPISLPVKFWNNELLMKSHPLC